MIANIPTRLDIEPAPALFASETMPGFEGGQRDAVWGRQPLRSQALVHSRAQRLLGTLQLVPNTIRHHRDRAPVSSRPRWLYADGQLTRHTSTGHIPIVVLTVYACDTERERAWRAGCDAFLSNACLPHVMLDEIYRLLAARVDTGRNRGDGSPLRDARDASRNRY
jgi:hypothetical protein